ncbi:hypothetical protein PVAG01_01400 [Phlyctema vagabunda]|uniref:Reverse transcriptase domain-containing protein n=1 Tax=Phlyctema vagabunda TaxID=108571 RepID=A0ABR4PX20_9HELO
MASTDILSSTLSSITSIKLDELSIQRTNFESGKAELLQAIKEEPSQLEKVQIFLDLVGKLPTMGKLNKNPSLSLENTNKFLDQARLDPSISPALQKEWQIKLEKELDVHSVRYEYAALYGQLVNEWLFASKSVKDPISTASEFEELGRKEMYEQRKTWEDYVFKPCETETAAIDSYLEQLFNSNKQNTAAKSKLQVSVELFEDEMSTMEHFDEKTLTWTIEGLLGSDLLTDEKRAVLNDFLGNEVVLAELGDVLNMRMLSLDKWKWDSAGTPVEQRRHLNGRYRFYHDEDLLQSILLRYIGIKWSVFFKRALEEFRTVWKVPSEQVSRLDRKRRNYFLGLGRTESIAGAHTVEYVRNELYTHDIFLEQLQSAEDQPRGYDSGNSTTSAQKTPQQTTQAVLHALATEIIMKTRLGEDVTVIRSDFKWFGPSLPHSTMFTVLKFFGASAQWIDFFRRALEAPMRFTQDGPEATVLIRKRGTPISGPLSDVLAETVLFCLDFDINQSTNGARLYRLHDDIWFWGSADMCVSGWATMQKFASLMGLDFSEEKTGSVTITRKGDTVTAPPESLPKGDVRWGFLKLDAVTGRFLIDQENVDRHVEELRCQLDACNSIFDWIQAWNIYGARFFTTNFGRPANCFGLQHVDMMLETFARIQKKLFPSGSVTSHLTEMISKRFGVKDIPAGYLYFPMVMGGLELKNPFVNPYLIRPLICENPDKLMDEFFVEEEEAYNLAKEKFDSADVQRSRHTRGSGNETFGDDFISFEEYTRFREQTSRPLRTAYDKLLTEPDEEEPQATLEIKAYESLGIWDDLTSYERWIIQIYASDMIAHFGALNVVEKGLLPVGMVKMFRASRFQWQG